MDIYDNGGASLDRYTIFLDANSDDYIAADTDGDGFYQHGDGGKRGRHLGKKVPFTSLSTKLRIRLAHE